MNMIRRAFISALLFCGACAMHVTAVSPYDASFELGVPQVHAAAHGSVAFVPPANPSSVQAFGEWGGGFVVGLNTSPLGIVLSRTDSFGGYLLGSDGIQHQLMTQATMAQASCAPSIIAGSCFGFFPVSGASQVYQGGPGGIISLCASPVDSHVAFFYWGNGQVFKTTDLDKSNPEGEHWINTQQLGTGFPDTGDGSNVTLRTNGEFMQCDPNDVNHMILGSQGTGVSVVTPVAPQLFETTDGGATFQTLNVPAATTAANYIIEFDANSGVVPSGPRAGQTNRWWVGVNEVLTVNSASWDSPSQTITYNVNATLFTPAPRAVVGDRITIAGFTVASPIYNGTKVVTAVSGNSVSVSQLTDPGTAVLGAATLSDGAIYTTEDGGTTIQETTPGGPDTMRHADAGPTDHSFWFVDASGVLWKYAPGTLGAYAGTWSNPSGPSALQTVAVNPLNGQQVLGFGQGMFVSTDGGNIFGAIRHPVLAPGDSPWLAPPKGNLTGFTVAAGAFDTLNPGAVIINAGQGVWRSTFTDISTNAPFTWSANSKGIMQPIGFQMLGVGGGKFIAGYQDLTSCTLEVNNPTPLNCNPMEYSKSLEFASGIAVSQTDPTFSCEKVSEDFAGDSDYSSCSKDFFVADWMPFNKWNAIIPVSNVSSSTTPGFVGKTHISVVGTPYTTTGISVYDNNGGGSILCTSGWNFHPSPGTNLNQGPGMVGCVRVLAKDATSFDLDVAFQAQMVTGVSPAVYPAGSSYVIFDSAAPMSNWGGSLNITGIGDDGSGHIRITYMSTLGGGGVLANPGVGTAPNELVDISGAVDAAGNPIAAGRWNISNLNLAAKTFTLTNSSSAGLPTYDHGGAVKTWGEPGGSLAMATNDNIVIMPASGAASLRCTLNRGADGWPELVTTPATGPGVAITTLIAPAVAGDNSIRVANTATIKGATTPNGTVIQILMDDGRYFYAHTFTVVKDSVGTSGTVTFFPPDVVPPGRSLANGAVFYNGNSGWQISPVNNRHTITVDQGGNFFADNSNTGLYKWTGCNSPTLVNSGGPWNTGAGGGGTLTAVPGQSGHLISTIGPVGTFGLGGTRLYRTCNGDSNVSPNGVDLTDVFPGIYASNVFGFMGPKTGTDGYATLLVSGWYSYQDDLQVNAIEGLFESTDDPNNGNHGPNATCKNFSASFTGSISGNVLTTPVTSNLRVGQGIRCATCILTPTIISGGPTSWVLDHTYGSPIGPIAMTSGGTFHRIMTYPTALAGNSGWQSKINGVAGDPVYGPVGLNSGNGAYYLICPCPVLPYLLERDIHPHLHDNDNDPVGLAKVG